MLNHPEYIEMKQRFDALIELIQDAVLVHTDHVIQYVNPAALKTLGATSLSELVGIPLLSIVHPEYIGVVQKRVNELYQQQLKVPLMEAKYVRMDGKVLDIEGSADFIYYNGKPSAIAVFRDVTERNMLQQNLFQFAYYDNLTKLPNRLTIERRVMSMIEKRQLLNSLFGLLINISNLKRINDTLGHKIGDEVLKIIASKLQSHIPANGFIGRWEGDNFFVLLSNFPRDDLDSYIQTMLEDLEQSVHIGSYELIVAVRIGISSGIDGDSGEELTADILFKNMNYALQLAKQSQQSFVYYMHSNDDADVQLKLENDLYKALGDRQFVLHYQPKVHVETGKVTGAEALIRWQHPEMGLLVPNQFIPIAEANGFIVQLGEWVLTEACRQINDWEVRYGLKVNVSVNVSPHQLLKPKFAQTFIGILNQYNVNPKQIEIEITENFILHPSTKKALLDIEKLGISIAIDDFGKEYSFFDYLQQFNFKKMKIDQSFVFKIEENRKNSAIVEALIQLGHTLGMEIVAEGVENFEQLDYLKRYYCDEYQGYYFSHPVDSDTFIKMLLEK